MQLDMMENDMSHLKALKFIEVPKATGTDPVLARREQVIARLQDQKMLAADPAYEKIVTRTIKDANGAKRKVELRKRPRPAWRINANGAVVLTVPYGFKPIEFERGKAGIAVQSMDKLDGVFETLIAAVKAGELDQLLELQVKAKVERKSKRAA